MIEHPLSEYRLNESHSEVKINGEWKTYSLMSKNFNTPYQKGDYLGTSNEIRIDGANQNQFDIEFHFWQKAEKL